MLFLTVMSQFCNPIKGKLTKMKQSLIQRDTTFSEETPVKGAHSRANDENQDILPFERTLTNVNSLRKLELLEKKSSRKQESITFYRRELARRKQKYETQLLQVE